MARFAGRGAEVLSSIFSLASRRDNPSTNPSCCSLLGTLHVLHEWNSTALGACPMQVSPSVLHKLPHGGELRGTLRFLIYAAMAGYQEKLLHQEGRGHGTDCPGQQAQP